MQIGSFALPMTEEIDSFSFKKEVKDRKWFFVVVLFFVKAIIDIIAVKKTPGTAVKIPGVNQIQGRKLD